MQTWQQIYDPLGNLWLSALIALIPILFFFIALIVLRLKGYIAGAITLLLALLAATFIFKMPATMALSTAIYGFLYGLWPIAWIIVAAVFLYKLTVKSGQFAIIRASVLQITDDKRLQVLLIGFCFGAFLEGAAGYGAPVAITAALLVGLGFNPLYAAGLCLIANTAPVAFGALGIPIIVAGQVTDIDPFKIGAVAGRQLPILSVIVPLWLVAMMDGIRGIKETLPATMIVGISFALTQYFTSNYIGPELPDITSALVSMICLAMFLRVWKPVRSAASVSDNVSSINIDDKNYNLTQIISAWMPFLVLTVMVTIWTLKPFKALFAADAIFGFTVFLIEVPFLHNLVVKIAPIVSSPTAMSAVYKFDPLGATGTAIFLSAVITIFLAKIDFKTACATFIETLVELKWPILSIGIVLSFAFVTNYSGMSTTLALVLASTGVVFPFFSPFLGWLGVFLTGSDTSSNALFCSLQATTASQIGVDQTLLVAANTTGGVTGKMISPQSIAVACAATGMVGRESELFRFTLKHSLIFASFVGVITMAQAYWLTFMLV